MIDKPVHRRGPLMAADQNTPSKYGFWLIPGLLLVQALFVGTTFYTLTLTLVSLLFASLVVGVVLQALGTREELLRRNAAVSNTENGKSATGAGIATGTGVSPRHAAKPQKLAKRHVLKSLTVVPAVVIVAGLTAGSRVLHHLTDNLNPVAMIVDVIAHAMLLASIVLWVFYSRRGHPAMLGCGLLLMMTTVTAGGVSHSINGQLVAALSTVAAFVFAADHILGYWNSERSDRRRTRSERRRAVAAERKRSRQTFGDQTFDESTTAPLPATTVSLTPSRGWNPKLYSVLALSILLMSTTALGHLANNIVPGLQLDIFDRLSQSLEAVTSNSIVGGSRYVRGSKLGTIRRHMLGDPGDPAVKAYAEQSPGYLRGTAFDLYAGGRWSAASERMLDPQIDPGPIRTRRSEIEMPGKTPLRERSSSPLNRFNVRKNPGGTPVGTIEVHNYPLKGRVVFSALSTDWVEGSTFGSATLSHHDLVVKGVNTSEPYVLGITAETPSEKLDPLRKNLMLSLPRGLGERIGPITKSICRGSLTARSKAKAIEEYFQENYSYSLNSTTTPGKKDPIVNFLESQHPAHCEYFASAAAVMLRTEGVPTRYVTGYVLGELSEDGNYWIARNRDAHAWVEAYDEITEQWFPVEATVGRTYRTLSNLDLAYDDTEGVLGSFLDDSDDRGLFSQVVGWILSFRATDSLTFVFQIAQLPLFCLVVALLWIRHRRKLRAGDDPLEFASRQMLNRVDRKVRKYQLIRRKGETLHQFASRLESTASEKAEQDRADAGRFLRDAADWYREFASARYRGTMPSPM